jgi:hypothetical protein
VASIIDYVTQQPTRDVRKREAWRLICSLGVPEAFIRSLPDCTIVPAGEPPHR